MLCFRLQIIHCRSKKNRTEASHGSFRFLVNEKKLVFVRILTSKQRMRASWIIILIIK